MTISAADHDDPTKATITDVATLIASGGTRHGRQHCRYGIIGLLVGYVGDLALVGVARAHCFGGVVIQACRRRLGCDRSPCNRDR